MARSNMRNASGLFSRCGFLATSTTLAASTATPGRDGWATSEEPVSLFLVSDTYDVGTKDAFSSLMSVDAGSPAA